MEERFCTNCGSKIAADADFCGNCGAKQMETEVEFKDRGTISMFDEGSNPTGSGNSSNGDMLNTTIYGQPIQSPPKKKNTALIIGIVAAALLVLVSIWAIIKDSSSDKKDDIDSFDYNISETANLLDELGDSQIETEKIEKAYSKGILTATSYESSYFDLKFNAPEGWFMQTADEISKQYGEDTDLVKYEMSATNAYSGEVITVFTEKLPTKNLTVEQYIDISKANMQKMEFKNLFRDGTMVIAGNTYNTMTFNVTDAASGVNVNVDYYVRKVQDRIICIMAMYLPGNQANVEVGIRAFTPY